MAKGQNRSNKEVKKPKKEKPAPTPPASFSKGVTVAGATKKK